MNILPLAAGFLCCLVPSTLGALTQPHHAHLLQRAYVSCSTASVSNNAYLDFFLETNGDTVADVYTVNKTDHTDTSYYTFGTNGSQVTGSGSSADPYTFRIQLLNIRPLTLTTQGSFAYVEGDDTVMVNVLVKSIYDPILKDHVVFPDDVIYTASCNFSQVVDELVSTGQLNVTGYVVEAPTPITEVAILEVLNATSETPVSSVPIGEMISLQARPTQPSFAKGTYAHTCKLCDQSDCGGAISLDIINPSGCSNVNYIPSFTNFAGSARTAPFKAIALSNKNLIYFQCLINFCYVSNQQECTDLCAAGRKKRSVEDEMKEPDQLLTVALQLFSDENGDIVVSVDQGNTDTLDLFSSNILNQQSESRAAKQRENEVMLYTVVALSVLTTVGLIIAGLVFYKFTKRNRKN